MSTVQATKQKAQRVASEASPWIEKAGRIGYVARGVIYGMIGVLAFLAASGDGGKTTDQKGAINTIANMPFGQALLVALGIGLIGFCLFRLTMAAFNPEQKKPIKRIGYTVSGLGYGGFGVLALMASMGNRAQDNSQEQAATVMQIPGGQWVIVAIGLVLLGVGFAQLYNGFTAKFMKVLKTREMSKEEEAMAHVVGRTGLISRGVVFLIVGGFFVYSGLNRDPSKTDGIDQALAAIAKAPSGALLLAAIGIGLVLYGLYMFVEARYRRFTPVQPQG